MRRMAPLRSATATRRRQEAGTGAASSMCGGAGAIAVEAERLS